MYLVNFSQEKSGSPDMLLESESKLVMKFISIFYAFIYVV